jgi:hypothetical protein
VISPVKTREGMWGSFKLGKRGTELLMAGQTGLSPEVDEDGYLIGVALCVRQPAGLPSARVYDVPAMSSSMFASPEPSQVLPPSPLRISAPLAKVDRSGLVEGKVWTIVNGAPGSSPPFTEYRAPDPIIRRDEFDPEAEARRLQAWYEDRLRSFEDARTWWPRYLEELKRRRRSSSANRNAGGSETLSVKLWVWPLFRSTAVT